MTLHNCTQKILWPCGLIRIMFQRPKQMICKEEFSNSEQLKSMFLEIRWKVPFFSSLISLWKYFLCEVMEHSSQCSFKISNTSKFLGRYSGMGLIFNSLLCVWCNETLCIVFDINYREKHYVFDILPLKVCISVETLLPVYDNYYSVFGYQLKHSFSCMIITTRCLDFSWNTPSRVW